MRKTTLKRLVRDYSILGKLSVQTRTQGRASIRAHGRQKGRKEKQRLRRKEERESQVSLVLSFLR